MHPHPMPHFSKTGSVTLDIKSVGDFRINFTTLRLNLTLGAKPLDYTKFKSVEK